MLAADHEYPTGGMPYDPLGHAAEPEMSEAFAAVRAGDDAVHREVTREPNDPLRHRRIDDVDIGLEPEVARLALPRSQPLLGATACLVDVGRHQGLGAGRGRRRHVLDAVCEVNLSADPLRPLERDLAGALPVLGEVGRDE
jgi:hypothetical protein